jgi:membrane-associated phospholipid phosphatase
MSSRFRASPGVLGLGLALSLAACTDATGPAPTPAGPQSAAVKFWESGSAVAWNRIGSERSTARNVGPVVSARILAYLSIAQYNAVIAAEDAARGGERPSVAGAVAGASFVVLRGFLALDGARLQDSLASQRSAPRWPGERTSDFAAGEAIGRAIGEQVLAYAATDNFNVTPAPPNPGGFGYWTGVNPVRGLYGVRPLTLDSPSQFRSPTPPTVGGEAFNIALEEIRTLTANLTPAQLAIAQRWAVTGAPSLNDTATALIVAYHRSEKEAARVLALTNMALFDATIGCFDAKLAYYYIRPVQYDPTIKLSVGMPNHPSYPSGHSCQTAAVVTVLESAFPAERERLEALIVEAGLSRMYGGLHYRFDCTAGQDLGRGVAAWVLANAGSKQTAIALD